MIGIVIISHGDMSDGILDAVRIIMGEQERITTVNLREMDSVEGLMDRISEAIDEVNTGNGVLLMVDLFGASPFNAGARLALTHGNIEVIAGVSLPMLLEVVIQRGNKNFNQLVEIALEAGTSDIKTLSDTLTNDKVAADPLQVTLLKAVAPIGAKVSVLSIKGCVEYCNSLEKDNENILIIAKFQEDGLALVEKGLKMSVLNLGNQAFVRCSKKISNTVFLTESCVKALKKLHEKSIRITCRMMPSDSENDYWPKIEKTLPEWAQ